MAANPVVAIATKQWDGIDGNWSTFRISVGEPGQDFRVLVSTRGGATWVPSPEGCKEDDKTCPWLRGVDLFNSQPSRGFQLNSSNTWRDLGTWSLGLEENLGIGVQTRAPYGLDTVHLGFSQNTAAVEVNATQVAAYPEPGYWMGLLGMSNAQAEMGNETYRSLIQTLNDSSQIPSQSYGYTAGAHHRNTGVHGSLVIGGYDQSRFQSPPYEFPFRDDFDQFLMVGLQSIYTNFSLTERGRQNLVRTGHLSAIDSTVSQLWLPEDACDSFAAAFGLSYNETENYYLINDTMHAKLQLENPTLTFLLGRVASATPNNSIEIKLPYAAFDHYIHPPATQNLSRYFPIRRAQDGSQYTIGRVFLQEAYLTVDYERNNFSLAQAYFADPMPDPDIRPIHTLNWTDPTTTPSPLSTGVVAGISIGAVAGLLTLTAIYLCWWRPRRAAHQVRKRPSIASQAPPYQEHAPPQTYHDGKPYYDPWVAANPFSQQQDEHDHRHRQHSVPLEMPGVEHQARRPELDGSGAGGSSYELPVPAEARREGDRGVYEMDVGGDAPPAPAAAPAAGQGDGGVVGKEVGRRASERRRLSRVEASSP